MEKNRNDQGAINCIEDGQTLQVRMTSYILSWIEIQAKGKKKSKFNSMQSF